MRGSYVLAMTRVLSDLGVDSDKFLQESGITKADIVDDRLLDFDVMLGALKLAYRYANRTEFGLIVGERLNINTHGSLGYALMASSDLAEAARLLIKYYKVQVPAAEFRLTKQEGNYTLEILPATYITEEPEIPWFASELMMTTVYKSAEFLLAGDVEGLSAHFNFSEPPHIDLYKKYFKVPCYFDQGFDGFKLAEHKSQQAIASADPLLAHMFEKQCAEILKNTQSKRIADQVKLLQSDNVGHFLSQKQVANILGLSVSTLYRKLSEEGTSFKKVLADLKREIAIEHVLAEKNSIEEIASFMGFSDASNFRRAFISWTGKTPSEYRKSKRIMI